MFVSSFACSRLCPGTWSGGSQNRFTCVSPWGAISGREAPWERGNNLRDLFGKIHLHRRFLRQHSLAQIANTERACA